MSDDATSSDSHGHHDWHSAEYVDDWISNDRTRDQQRRPWLRRLVRMLPFASDQPIRALDVGAGYAMLSREVLDEYPASTVVLHDFSTPMFDHARRRLADVGDRVDLVASDLREADWTEVLGGDTFDAVVSAIAIHNVREPALIRRIYADIRPLVRPGGCFYNLDFVMPAGPLSARALLGPESRWVPSGALGEPSGIPTLEGHLAWLRTAGFDEADCLFRAEGQTAVAGFVA